MVNRQINTSGSIPAGSTGSDWATQRGGQQWINDPSGSDFPERERQTLLDMQAQSAYTSYQDQVAAAMAANASAEAARARAVERKMAEAEARQRAREAEEDRRYREAEAERKERERVGRESAFDSVARWAEERGMDPGQVKSAFKTLGRFDYENQAKLLATVRATQTWTDRFGAVTKAREKNGLNYMSEDDILRSENDYREALSQYGLPKNFYDSKDDFQNWLANDVSVAEVTDRAKLASAMADSVDQATKDAFQQHWGVGSGDLTAYFLDRTRATALLEKQVQAAQLGAEADTAGVAVGRGLLEDLAGKGVGRQEMRAAAEKTGVTQDDWKRLAQVSGQNLTQASLLSANLGMDVNTTKKLKGLASQERGRFGGSSGGTSALGSSSVGAY